MTRTKKIAKILTSLQERSVKTKMSKDDEHMTINIMSRGKDGKKGTDDDPEILRHRIHHSLTDRGGRHVLLGLPHQARWRVVRPTVGNRHQRRPTERRGEKYEPRRLVSTGKRGTRNQAAK